jgi:hypothetical protein
LIPARKKCFGRRNPDGSRKENFKRAESPEKSELWEPILKKTQVISGVWRGASPTWVRRSSRLLPVWVAPQDPASFR